MEAPGQGQAGGEGRGMFSAHAQASWPPAPGPLLRRDRSRGGQVVAVGQAGVLIAPLIG